MRRVRELVDSVRLAYPNDTFFDRFTESCRESPAKRKAYRTYDDTFRWLDTTSWALLKAKAIAHYRDHRGGQLKQGLFNQLNEAFAYRYLVRHGYSAVRLLPEIGKRVPDLAYLDGRRQRYCEVKTLNISDEEIARRESARAFSNVYLHLSDPFFHKLRSAIAVARSQIAAQAASGLVFIVVLWDDFALDNYRSYRRELASFANADVVQDVHVKVGLRFNRRMRLAGFPNRPTRTAIVRLGE